MSGVDKRALVNILGAGNLLFRLVCQREKKRHLPTEELLWTQLKERSALGAEKGETYYRVRFVLG